MFEVVVVGCGAMGARHAQTIARSRSARLVGVVDPDTARRRAVAHACLTEAFTTVPDGVQAAVVATPNATHAPIAKSLLDRGLWVLLEKPMCLTSAEAGILSSDRLSIGHSERFNPGLRGRIRRCERQFSAIRTGPVARPSATPLVFDRMIHDLDLALWWCGPLELVDAWTTAQTLEVSLKGGANVRLTAAFGGPLQRTLCIDGATIDLLTPGEPDALTAQWSAFESAIRGETPVPVPSSEAAAAVALAESIQRIVNYR